MKLIFLSFAILFVLPMSVMIGVLPDQTKLRVAGSVALAVVLFGAALLLPRLLRWLAGRRARMPSPRRLALLDWPDTLTQGQMEACCVAWLRGRGWDATLVTDSAQQAEDVFVLATLGPRQVVLLCDRYGEGLNPAEIRAFAAAGAEFAGARRVLVTLLRGKLPRAAEVAAAQAGVTLLRVPELSRLDELVPAGV
jgi:hypothetical protein